MFSKGTRFVSKYRIAKFGEPMIELLSSGYGVEGLVKEFNTYSVWKIQFDHNLGYLERLELCSSTAGNQLSAYEVSFLRDENPYYYTRYVASASVFDVYNYFSKEESINVDSIKVNLVEKYQAKVR